MSVAFAAELAQASGVTATTVISLDSLFTLLFGGLVAYFFWVLKQQNIRQQQSLDKTHLKLDATNATMEARTREFAEARSLCREQMLESLGKKADRDELVRAHARIDSTDQKVCNLDVLFQSHIKEDRKP